MVKKVSKAGINLIKEFEGCELKAYKDSVGVWTIGYGTTNADKGITSIPIGAGLCISQETADKWLERSLNKKYVPRVLKYDSKYDWNQNELDALVSFAYNIGSIDQLTDHGKRSKAVISSKILSYNKAGGKVLKGLTRRRRAEKALFDKKSSSATQTKNSKSSVKTVKSGKDKKLKVAAKSGLNLRTGAGAKHSKILTIPYGKTVIWNDSKSKYVGEVTWYKITYNNKTGYAMAKWLKPV